MCVSGQCFVKLAAINNYVRSYPIQSIGLVWGRWTGMGQVDWTVVPKKVFFHGIPTLKVFPCQVDGKIVEISHIPHTINMGMPTS